MFLRTLLSTAVSLVVLFPGSVLAESSNSARYKVLSNQNAGLSVNTIRKYIDSANKSIDNRDFDKAISQLKKARKVSNLLAGYYRDINGSFRGLDARIPREMNKKNREVISLLADANLKLANIHRIQKEAELAVPLLVDVLKLMTPIKPQGLKAYQNLYELGFVETPYAGLKKALE